MKVENSKNEVIMEVGIKGKWHSHMWHKGKEGGKVISDMRRKEVTESTVTWKESNTFIYDMRRMEGSQMWHVDREDKKVV